MHCDTLSLLLHRKRRGEECSLRSGGQHLDLEKMKAGNYLLQCFAVFVELKHSENPLLDALEMIDLFYEEMEKNRDVISPVFRYEDIEKNRREGKMSAMLTAEEGQICASSLGALRDLYRLGVRMMTLTWNYENDLAFPNDVLGRGKEEYDFRAEQEKGLKEKGFLFIEEMERLHMLIDVSHLSDAGFWDVCHAATKPFVASHSNARAVCSHVRNLTDDMIRAMGERGCVVGLNYCGSFLNEAGARLETYPSRIEDMVRHVKYITNLGGVELAALGSDFDGIGGDLELADASCLLRLYDALRRAGFHEKDVDRIFFGNILRVFRNCLP